MIHIYYKLSFSFKINRVGRCFSLSLGGGVRPASQNPYPIYDQNLRYSLPYLGMDDKTWTINYLSDRRHFVQIDDLGVHLDSQLDWKEHVTKLLSSCYGVLAALRKIRHLAPFKVRKQLAQCLVLSKLDYCNTIFHPLPEYQIKRLQRVQNTCAALVLRHHAKSSDVLNLNWLPIRERIELSLLKVTHKSLYYEGWPKNLQLEFQRSCSYNLLRFSVPRETDTFKSMAARSFNSLPDSVRQLTDYHTFTKATRKHLFQKLKTQVV